MYVYLVSEIPSVVWGVQSLSSPSSQVSRVDKDRGGWARNIRSDSEMLLAIAMIDLRITSEGHLMKGEVE